MIRLEVESASGGEPMKKPHATAMNALKHGLFRQVDHPMTRSAFAFLAEKTVPGRLGQELAADIMRAEIQTARCRATVLHHTQAIEALFAEARFSSDDPATRIDEALGQLTRLLRYQNDSLTTLRKSRIAILNAAEGLSPLPRKSVR